MTTFASNKKVFHNYRIDETLEAGIALLGHEVKSVKEGNASLMGAYVTIRNNEAFLRNAYIGKYKYAASLDDYQESRDRKLLLHKKEILRLLSKTKEQGATLVPLDLHAKNKRIKLKIGLGLGKKQHDKREAIKKKELKRKIERTVRSRV